MTNRWAAILLLFTINTLPALAFTETSLTPPGGNTVPPLNVGSINQSKAGDLEAESYKSRDGITLGGEKKTEWPAIGMACNWEGVKCSCKADESSVGNLGIAISVTCINGHVTGFQIADLQISSREKRCVSATACSVSAGDSGFGGAIKGAVRTVVSKVVSVVRKIGRFFRKWF